MAFPEDPESDSYKYTEVSTLAETIVLLNSQLHLESKRCDELKTKILFYEICHFVKNMYRNCPRPVENPAP